MFSKPVISVKNVKVNTLVNLAEPRMKLDVPEELAEKFYGHCVKEGIDAQTLILRMITFYFENADFDVAPKNEWVIQPPTIPTGKGRNSYASLSKKIEEYEEEYEKWENTHGKKYFEQYPDKIEEQQQQKERLKTILNKKKAA